MITTCTECQARYQLDADKIPPRVIKVRCPSCGGVFSLDGSQAQIEAVQPRKEPQAVQGRSKDVSSPPAFERPTTDVQAPVPAEPQTAPAATVEPVVSQAAPSETVPVEPAAAEPATAEPATGVAVMDRPAASSSRRRRSKEEMLARALVSDIMVYNRDLYDQAKAQGNLLEALGSEIKKSWELYKEKVTPEVANSTNHFRDALNEILADGEDIF
jgi:predicted Zn finger-like uncharacterized protein